jgi:hypothetical protein
LPKFTAEEQWVQKKQGEFIQGDVRMLSSIDVEKPFQSVQDAVQRLLPFHVSCWVPTVGLLLLLMSSCCTVSAAGAEMRTRLITAANSSSCGTVSELNGLAGTSSSNCSTTGQDTLIAPAAPLAGQHGAQLSSTTSGFCQLRYAPNFAPKFTLSLTPPVDALLPPHTPHTRSCLVQ